MKLNDLKDLSAIIICLLFTFLGLFTGDKIFWFPTLFFCIGAIVLTYSFFRKSKNIPVLADDELFLQFQDKGYIEYYDWGFYDENAEKIFYWHEIQKVFASKEDKITTDEVYVVCTFTDSSKFSIGEETSGWNQFIRHLEENLAIQKNWRERIIKPAFARNETMIYQR